MGRLDTVVMTVLRAAVAALMSAAASAWAAPASVPAGQTDPFLALLNRKPPAMPHEAEGAVWPRSDYFQDALRLTSARPQDRGRKPSLRLAADAPRLAFAALPVQTQAFGFGPTFRALLGAELDAYLLQLGVPATGQTDIVDVHGPFVRRLDDEAVAAIVPERSEGIVLYAGHDGIDTAFLTLTVQRRPTPRIVHRSVPLPTEPGAALSALSFQLPAMLVEAGLPLKPRDPGPDAGCDPAAWSLAEPTPATTPRQLACQALAIGTLLPDHDLSQVGAAPQSSPARLAWLARAHALARRDGQDGPVGRALADLAWHQLGMTAGQPVPAHSTASDPVLGRVSRLLRAPLLVRSPARSVQDAIEREAASISDGLSPLVRESIRARALYDDGFASIDACRFERAMPGAMVRATCRTAGDGVTATAARPATRAEQLVFQEWRVGTALREVRRVADTQGRVDDAIQRLGALPADVAAHPWLRRMQVDLSERAAPAGGSDAALRRARETSAAVLASTADMQRLDDWARRHVLTEGGGPRDLNLANDAAVRALAQDQFRLVSVLRFDRFEPGLQPERRFRGEAAFFLEPVADQVPYAQMMVQRARPAAAAPAPGASPAVAQAPVVRPLFQRESVLPVDRLSMAESEARLRIDPGYITARLDLALARLRRGGPPSEAVELLRGHPVNQRSDDRVDESHKLGAAAGALYYIGEVSAAREFYQRTVALGTGSESESMAVARLWLIDGQWPQAMEAMQRWLARYDTDVPRRDLAGMLFLSQRPQEAWALLTPRLGRADRPALWTAAMTGHRLEGLEAAQATEWLTVRDLDRRAVDFATAPVFYTHLLSVVDRRPGDAEIDVLSRSDPERGGRPEARWAASAWLMRAALDGADPRQVHRQVLVLLKDDDNFERQRFMLPAYVWSAFAATDGRDPVLDRVRRADLDDDFEGLLAKSILRALEGDTTESMRYFAAARMRFADIGRNSPALERRPVPVDYQWALAGYLLHRRTGVDAYRVETLRLLRARQRTAPYVSWTYAMEAALEKAPKPRLAAACRARQLDRGSYFLGVAGVPGLSEQACRSLLR